MSNGESVPRYTMRQLAAFVAVAETGTISAAAERLHASHSALAAAVTDLERALNVQLTVRRRAHGVRLTPTGETVLIRARALLHQATELQADAGGPGGGVSGPLALGCYTSLGPTVLPSLLRSYTVRYPQTRVELHEDTQNRLRKQLVDGEVDLVIAYALDLPDEWRTAVLGTRRPHVLVGPEHPLTGADGPVRLAELAEDPMILLDAPPSSYHALEVCRQAGFEPRVAYRTQNYETARAFVGRDLGWTLLVQRPAPEVTYEGLPVVVKELHDPRPDPVGVVVAWHRGSMLSRAARAFIRFATSEPEDSADFPGNHPR
ncbi:LysR family transcriptional regulator [Saccharopolyspora sp. HNM0983]|uniref:LysR family transcriptional regulator n=1 Tax=Saccharopolyspora montiporae TaxID=2781240 RepID=A0A929B8Z9_9PSEU|nr:LysR family transcriptional regulator [Saccharopolyspora sp. HNM0983]MBE9373616.1 LysR family transcriptional regulator [Saccharopolyspora sp. HNM0983]